MNSEAVRPYGTQLVTMKVFVALVGILGILLGSCGGEESARSGETGRVKLPLVITVDDGGEYRLEGTLKVRGGGDVDGVDGGDVIRSIVVDENTDVSDLEFELEPGRYTITLEDGWQLYDEATDQPVEATVVKNPLEFVVRPWETVTVAFDFLIGDIDTDGGVRVDLSAGEVHSLTGRVVLNSEALCVPSSSGPCGPLSELEGAEVDFVMLFNIEGDAFVDGKRQITTSPAIIELFGDSYVEAVVGPALIGQAYQFVLEPDGQGNVTFSSGAVMEGEGAEGAWESSFELVVGSSAGNGGEVQGITSLTTAGIPPFEVNGGNLRLTATSNSVGGTTTVFEAVSGIGTFYYDRYKPPEPPEQSEPVEDTIVRYSDLIVSSDGGYFFDPVTPQVVGGFGDDQIPQGVIDGRNYVGVFESKTVGPPYSQQIDQWTSNDVTVTADQATAPDGASTADRVTENTSGSGSPYVRGLVTTTADTASGVAWVKDIDRGYVQLRLIHRNWPEEWGVCVVNLSDGTVEETAVGVGYGAAPEVLDAHTIAIDGGYLIFLTVRLLGAQDTDLYVDLSDGATPTRDVNGRLTVAMEEKSIYVWQAQAIKDATTRDRLTAGPNGF